MKCLIVSDLHVYEKGSTTSERISRDSLITTDESKPNPLTNLLTYCEKHSITADVLICPGDLGDKADSAGITHAWTKLKELANQVKAKQIFAVSGNHDLDSSLVDNEYDVREHLVHLEPHYPTSDKAQNCHYWTYGYYVSTEINYNLIGINTCHYHGYDPKEIKHGRLSEKTLHKLADELCKLPEKNINILLCHHAPSIFSHHELGEDDFLKLGTELIVELEKRGSDRWMIIHGHKHYPAIYNAQSVSGQPPLVLSSGSLGSTLYDKLTEHTGNQFHMLEFHTDSFKDYGLVGSIDSWEWNGINDWNPPNREIPDIQHYSGFGYTENVVSLSIKIAKQVQNTILKEADIEKYFPMLKFMLPVDLLNLRKNLESHKIGLHLDQGRVIELGVKTGAAK